jgi:hypothetical protein
LGQIIKDHGPVSRHWWKQSAQSRGSSQQAVTVKKKYISDAVILSAKGMNKA